MTAQVLPFPLVRRRAFVRRQAAWYAEQSPKAAEANLFRQLQIQRDVMLGRGIDGGEAEKQVRSLETAIRVLAYRLMDEPGVGA